MNKRRRNILLSVVFIIIGIAAATTLALKAFEENLLYFYSPSQISDGEAPTNRTFRIGGLVVVNSIERDPETLAVRFVLTDTLHKINVIYDGILPDLFKEGQGIVANGKLQDDGTFAASEVLAKHDENYMPPEVAYALDAARAQQAYVPGNKQP